MVAWLQACRARVLDGENAVVGYRDDKTELLYATLAVETQTTPSNV